MSSTMNTVYDETRYFTDKEMGEQGKGNVDVQSLVERPQVYILARQWSSKDEQIAYINTRKVCLEGFKNKVVTSNGIQITDVTRLFHDDGPQQEFENSRVERVVMLAVPAAVVMLESRSIYLFHFLNHSCH